MSNFPYPLFGTVLDSNGSAVSTKISMRNDRSGETTSTTSNSSGQYVLDASNFTSGYLTSDRVTIIVGWGDEEGSESILISSGTHEVDITLSAIAESTDTTYCQIQDVLDELGDKSTSDISYERVRKIILRAESEIDERSGTSWKVNTATDEIHDFNLYTSYKSPEQLTGYSTDMLVGTRNDHWNSQWNDRFKVEHTPIISVTSLYKNYAASSSADSWTELTEQEGSGGDFLVNTDTGIITFIKNVPSTGARRIKLTYTYGASSVPKVVERLAILLSVKDVLMSKSNDAQFTPVSLSVDGFSTSSSLSSSVTYFNWLVKEIDNLWKHVGDLAQGVA